MLPSSRVARYSSPVPNHSTTMSGVRSLSPARESSRPLSEDICLGTQSQRNTLREVEAAGVTPAKALILWYTLFVDPLPGRITLMSEVHSARPKALEYIAAAGNMEASEENLKIVSEHRYPRMTPP